MEAHTTNLGDSEESDDLLTKLSKQEKDKLIKLALTRISIFKELKRQLSNITNVLIGDIERMHTSSIKEINYLEKSLIKLIGKDKYNADELIKINHIFLLEIIIPTIDHHVLLSHNYKVIYDLLQFQFEPINSDDYLQRMNSIKKNICGGLNLILRSQDKSFYATGGTDGVIRTWDKEGNVKDAFFYGQNEIIALTLSADGNYLVSISDNQKLIIINLESPDTSLKFNLKFIFKRFAKGPIYKDILDKKLIVSISASNRYVLIYKILLIDIKKNTHIFFDSDTCISTIRQIGNKDYFLISSDGMDIVRCNFLNNTSEYDLYIKSDKDPQFSRNSKYIIGIDKLNQKFIVSKINLSVTQDCINKDREVIGKEFVFSKNYNKLKIRDVVYNEDIFYSENYKYAIYLVAETAYLWSTIKNEVCKEIKIGKNQKILGLSHNILFIATKYDELICWNLKTSKIKTLTIVIDFDTVQGASISKDFKFILIFDYLFHIIIEIETYKKKLLKHSTWIWFSDTYPITSPSMMLRHFFLNGHLFINIHFQSKNYTTYYLDIERDYKTHYDYKECSFYTRASNERYLYLICRKVTDEPINEFYNARDRFEKTSCIEYFDFKVYRHSFFILDQHFKDTRDIEINIEKITDEWEKIEILNNMRKVILTSMNHYKMTSEYYQLDMIHRCNNYKY